MTHEMNFLGTKNQISLKKCIDSYIYCKQILNAYAQKTVYFKTFWESKNTSIILSFESFEIPKQYKTEATYIGPPIPYRISGIFPFNGLCVKEVYKLRKLRIKGETI